MERKYYELSSAQKILFLSQKYTIYKQVNNIATSVLVDTNLDYYNMDKAVRLAYKRNDSFRIRIVEEDKQIKQYFAKHEDPQLEYLNFKDKGQKSMEKALYKLASKKVSNFGEQMSRIYFLRTADGKCGLFSVISHMIMDSWAICRFYKDVFEIYDSIVNKKVMPDPLYPYEELLKEELNYKNTQQYKSDLEYWQKELDFTEPIYAHVNGAEVLEKFRKKKKNKSLRYGPFFRLNSKSFNTMLPFPMDVVDQLKVYCAQNKVSMQSVIFLALRSYLAKVNNVDDVSMYTIVARRSKLKEKNTGGSRVHYMPLRTVFNDSDTLKTRNESISHRMSSIFRHANISPMEVTKIIKDKFGVPDLGTYFIGIMTFQPVKLELVDGTKIETKWYGNGAFSNPFYLTVMDGDAQGGLKFYYEYHKHGVKTETIKELHNYMIGFVKNNFCDTASDK